MHMFSNQERYMVQQLRKADVPVEKVSQLTGVSERSIRRIVQEPEVMSTEGRHCGKGNVVGRPSDVVKYESQVREWLSEERDPADGPVKSREVLARLRQAGYTGGKTAVYEVVKRLRPPKAKN